MQGKHPVDEILPGRQLFLYGLQHVLAMYAGAVAVPLIIAGAAHLTKEQTAFLINADLFTCGIATLIQTLGFWKLGIRLPIIQGVSFAAVTPMVMIASTMGMRGIYGAVIIAGLFAFTFRPLLQQNHQFLSPYCHRQCNYYHRPFPLAGRYKLGRRRHGQPRLWFTDQPHGGDASSYFHFVAAKIF